MTDGTALIRPATMADAPGIAAVHVAAWRSTYAGILPSDFLARMSSPRAAAQVRHAMRAGQTVLVAEAERRVAGYVGLGRARTPGLADGEIETLYVSDDWRDRGLGRTLLHRAAGALEQAGCGSAFLWVLEDNPARWFYERMAGRPVRRAETSVAGQALIQVAYVWDPIAKVMQANARA